MAENEKLFEEYPRQGRISLEPPVMNPKILAVVSAIRIRLSLFGFGLGPGGVGIQGRGG